MSSDSESDSGLPQEIVEAAKEAVNGCLPKKSKDKYEKVYKTYLDWKEEKKVVPTNEKVLLAYFNTLAVTLAPSTLWARWSMLKTMIESREHIDINKYKHLKRLLKEKSVGFVSKKSLVFTAAHVKKFLEEAPEKTYLDVKVALIMGMLGACRRQELKDMRLAHIKDDNSSCVMVTVPKTKTNVIRTFAVEEPYREIVLDFIKLRPKNIDHDCLFIKFGDGKCTKQVMGINKLGGMPKRMADYLQLDDAKEYTGHAFRRVYATLLAESGIELLTLKRHGGWKSDTTAEGYIADSKKSKRKICNRIASVIEDEESMDSSSSRMLKRVRISKNKDEDGDEGLSVNIQLKGCQEKNCSIQ